MDFTFLVKKLVYKHKGFHLPTQCLHVTVQVAPRENESTFFFSPIFIIIVLQGLVSLAFSPLLGSTMQCLRALQPMEMLTARRWLQRGDASQAGSSKAHVSLTKGFKPVDWENPTCQNKIFLYTARTISYCLQG